MTLLDDFELRSMPYLLNTLAQTSPTLSFHAQTQAEALTWQEMLRETVRRLLGVGDDIVSHRSPQTLETIDIEGIRRDLIVIQTQPDVYMPCYILTPLHGKPPYKTLMALHGHGTWGARSLVGIAETPIEQKFIHEFNMDYAWQLARQGYRVFAPVLRGFAERMEGTSEEVQAKLNGDDMWQSSCQTLSMNALLCGQTLLGLRVQDIQQLVAYIQSESDMHTAGLGCVGFSGGGTAGLFATALIPDITCAYLSGSVNTFRHSLLTIQHCTCNYVPGLAHYADMSDLAGLIAPRPLFIEGGRQDPIYPVAGVEEALHSLRQMYQVWNAPDHLDSDLFEGAHRWHGERAAAWFNQWL